MTHIKTRKYAPRVSLLASATLAAGFAPLAAQAADGAASGTNKATDLDKVQVRGSWFNPSSPKFTAELLDTPKSVSIVSEKLIAETGATNLQDALRMVPGITFGAGEGGNPTGDRPSSAASTPRATSSSTACVTSARRPARSSTWSRWKWSRARARPTAAVIPVVAA